MGLTGANTLMGLPDGRYDGHTHVFRADLPMIRSRRYTPDYHATPEDLCTLLTQHRLKGALLVQPSFLGTDNSYLLATLEKHQSSAQHLFKGVVVLDPTSQPDPGYLLEMAELGVIGVRLNLLRQEALFNYKDWQTVLAATEKLGWHVEVHSAAEHLPRVLPELVRHHNKVVVDHYGLVQSPENNAGFDALMRQPREKLWVKISAPYRVCSSTDNPQAVDCLLELRRRYLEFFGAEHLVWGSDWPFTQFENQITYQQVSNGADIRARDQGMSPASGS